MNWFHISIELAITILAFSAGMIFLAYTSHRKPDVLPVDWKDEFGPNQFKASSQVLR